MHLYNGRFAEALSEWPNALTMVSFSDCCSCRAWPTPMTPISWPTARTITPVCGAAWGLGEITFLLGKFHTHNCVLMCAHTFVRRQMLKRLLIIVSFC